MDINWGNSAYCLLGPSKWAGLSILTAPRLGSQGPGVAFSLQPSLGSHRISFAPRPFPSFPSSLYCSLLCVSMLLSHIAFPSVCVCTQTSVSICSFLTFLAFFFSVIIGFTVWKKEKTSGLGSKSHLVLTLLFFITSSQTSPLVSSHQFSKLLNKNLISALYPVVWWKELPPGHESQLCTSLFDSMISDITWNLEVGYGGSITPWKWANGSN